VTLFEKSRRVLAKVSVTGGGRCNLTNTFDEVTDLKQVYPRGYNLMKRLFRQFDHRDAWQWFEERGVALVAQSDQCVFPRSQDAASIVNCLVDEARRLGVRVVTRRCLTRIDAEGDGRLTLHFQEGDRQTFDRVLSPPALAPHRGAALP
jgi:predicted flavoprotein YhiN